MIQDFRLVKTKWLYCLIILLGLSVKLQGDCFNFFSGHPFYAGFGIGRTFGMHTGKGDRAGFLERGKSFDGKFDPGYTFNLRAGYRFSPCLRGDLQYIFMKTDFHWKTRFPELGVETFHAKYMCSLVFANYYLNLNPFFNFYHFDFYVTAGVGIASNFIYHIEERNAEGRFFARVRNNRHSSASYQLGLGLSKSFFCQRLQLSGVFNTYHLGKISTGNRRDIFDILPPFPEDLIGVYEFKWMRMGTLTVNLNYYF